MSTSKDSPKSRGIPAMQNDAAIKEAFSQRVDDHQPNGIAAQTARANQKRALQIMRQVRNRDR